MAQVRHLCQFATLVSAQAKLCNPPKTHDSPPTLCFGRSIFPSVFPFLHHFSRFREQFVLWSLWGVCGSGESAYGLRDVIYATQQQNQRWCKIRQNPLQPTMRPLVFVACRTPARKLFGLWSRDLVKTPAGGRGSVWASFCILLGYT